MLAEVETRCSIMNDVSHKKNRNVLLHSIQDIIMEEAYINTTFPLAFRLCFVMTGFSVCYKINELIKLIHIALY